MEKKYFDAAESIAGYEANTGCKASDYLVEMTRMMEPIINKAFQDGYMAAVKAALVADEMSQKQNESKTKAKRKQTESKPEANAECALLLPSIGEGIGEDSQQSP